MSEKIANMWFRFLLFIALASIFTACEPKYRFASIDQNVTLTNKHEKELSRRHLAYWDSMSQKNFLESYTFELPYQRYIQGQEWYGRFFEGNNKEYEIVLKDLEWIDDNRVLVHTEYIRQKNRHIFKDRWFYVNGTWYHMFDTSKLPKSE